MKIRTLDDFEIKGSLFVMNAGDAFSWSGNEALSNSVDAMAGNNTNMRLIFNWWANVKIFDESRYEILG